MKIITLICAIHIWLGTSILFGVPVPKPFGAFDPFFIVSFMTDFRVGLLLLVGGLLPLTAAYWPKRLWCISCFMVPQQLILTWGFIVGLIEFASLHDGRSWYALGYTGILFFAHARELSDAFLYEMIRRQSKDGSGN